jgi:hypothetical protein
LTRVTRIFQKSVFIKTVPAGPGGAPFRAFRCTHASAAGKRAFRSVGWKEITLRCFKRDSGNPTYPQGALTNLRL